MSDPVKFLLARIAEDEAVATMSDVYGTGNLAMTPRGIWNGPGQYPVIDARRLRDECEAKRRLIREIESLESTISQEFGEGDGPTLGLCFMAMPYASHRDFDPRWREVVEAELASIARYDAEEAQRDRDR